MDSSALVKRYMPETGTHWIRGLVSRQAAHDIVIAQITPVEMISAMGRQLHDTQMTLATFQSLRRFVLHHVQSQYQVFTLSNGVILRAIRLHEPYRLRAYDSVQLASALELQARLTTLGRSLTFLSADTRLLTAAANEGLSTDNPNAHP